jgi:predicted RNA-binding protein Jag
VTATPDDKRPQVEALLGDVFRLMEYPARLEFKDMADGSLGVAVHFEGELPGITPGKRSYLVDSVQFWLNKVVNRPNVPRRWINLGVGDFPPPRQNGQPAQPLPSAPQAAAAPRASAPPAATPSRAAPQKGKPAAAEKPAPQKAHGKGDAPPPREPRRGRENDERSLTVEPDPVVSALGTELAQKAARHGRLYGVMLVKPEARALMLQAADAVKGVSAKAEGEGHWRRVVFTPEKLVPLLKKQVMPDYDDDEEE